MNVETPHLSDGTRMIGDDGTITRYSVSAGRLADAVALLSETVTRHRTELADPERVRAATVAVREEARSAQPRREQLITSLRELAVAAGGVGPVVAAVHGVADVAHTLEGVSRRS